MKKLYATILLLLFLFLFFLYVLYNPKDYETNYKINEYNIKEKYVKELELYEFYINHNNKVYPLILEIEYTKQRKNIDSINIKNDQDNCLQVTIRNSKFPICYRDDEIIHYSLLEKKENPTEKKHFKTTTIYNYDEQNYYIWNYKGFDYISETDFESINIFENDNYENLLSFQTKDFIILPNYDEKYFFKEMYTLNVKNNKINKFNLNTEISYFSNFMGLYKKDLYLIDNKNEKQYKINPKTRKIKTVGTLNKNGIIINQNKLERKSIKTIINKDLIFTYLEKYNYILKNDSLYLKIGENDMLISDNHVKEIVQVIGDKVFYLSEDILYSFTPFDGEKILLQNKEWNFNYQNKIFIFNKN